MVAGIGERYGFVLFHLMGAEQGRGEWGEVQRRHPWAGVLDPRWNEQLLEAVAEMFHEDLRAKREPPKVPDTDF